MNHLTRQKAADAIRSVMGLVLCALSIAMLALSAYIGVSLARGTEGDLSPETWRALVFFYAAFGLGFGAGGLWMLRGRPPFPGRRFWIGYIVVLVAAFVLLNAS